jgi:haloacetate dehalogenase
MDEFATAEIDTGEARIFVRFHGAGEPLLLLHGFPETLLMWREVATILARDFCVVCADLRGYGRSSCPPSAPGHTPYSKRSMARDMVMVMEQLGYPRFGVAGHDRGGRVAYRMALDYPDGIEKLAVLDILPVNTVWERADDRLMLGYWPWSLLAQPAPLPERMLTASAADIVEHTLSEWGSASSTFPDDVRRAYVEAIADPEHAHAICEEYRAAATIDREHDATDRTSGRRIVRPMLALWSTAGPLGTWYDAEGGPLALWREWADNVRGEGLPGGHFFPEEIPERTAASLRDFFLKT